MGGILRVSDGKAAIVMMQHGGFLDSVLIIGWDNCCIERDGFNFQSLYGISGSDGKILWNGIIKRVF
jgi:hypothetical protein